MTSIYFNRSGNGEFRTIPMNQLLLETLKMVDNQSDFVFHRDDGKRFGDVRRKWMLAMELLDSHKLATISSTVPEGKKLAKHCELV